MATVLVIVCTIIVWILYHKLFHVTYFDLGNGCLMEVMGCVFVGFLLSVFISQLFS